MTPVGLHPVVQDVGTDSQVACDLGDRFVGLGDDAHRAGPELRVELAPGVSHDLIISFGSGLHDTREAQIGPHLEVVTDLLSHGDGGQISRHRTAPPARSSRRSTDP